MERRIIDIAKVFMLAYLGEGKEKKQSDFERDILSVDVLQEGSAANQIWFHTPFCRALYELLTEKKVVVRQDELAIRYYRITEKQLRLEDYILQLIKKRESDLDKLVAHKDQYTERDYHGLWSRHKGSIDDLYMSLTAYNNPLCQIKD